MVKLLVGIATPLAVAGVGYWLNQRLTSLEQAQWSQQKVIERRIKAYDELARPLNQLYCFYCYIGTWKELIPPDVVKMKRELDQTAYVSAPLFDPEFLDRYNAMIGACFKTFGRWGADAKLKTLPERRQEAAGDSWRAEWNTCFTLPDEATEPEVIENLYGKVMAYLATEIGVAEVNAHLLASARLPGNFDVRAAGVVSPARKEAAEKNP